MVNTPLSPSRRPLGASLTVSVSILMGGWYSRNLIGDCRPSSLTCCQPWHRQSRPANQASVTDNLGNRDNLGAGERWSTRKSESSPILWGRRDTQVVHISSVTEVIGNWLWRGVLWTYLAGRRLGKCRTFNPENWFRRQIREAYQDDEPTLEISRIHVCRNEGDSGNHDNQRKRPS